jgi:single-strand DNA-binding protein
MNLNKVSLIGNLTRDPAVRALPNGASLTTFTLATSYTWRDADSKERQEATEFHPVVAWGRLGVIVGKYLKKGDKVYIEGRLNTRAWEDKSGSKHYRTEVVASQLIMLGGKSGKADKSEKVNAEAAPEEVTVTKVPAEAER